MNLTHQSKAAPIATLIAIVSFTAFVFPGDVPFLRDEPMLLGDALLANHTPCRLLGISLPFTPATHGLQGTRGVAYGPLPLWIYQLLLSLTHNPIAIVSIRAALVSGSTAVALLWLARTMRLSAWYAPLSMLSPWLWLLSRKPWDNSFCIPLSALAIAAYASFLATRRRAPLLTAAASLEALTLVHFMSLALIIPMVLHAVCFQRPQIKKFAWSLFAIAAPWLAILPFYFTAIRHSLQFHYFKDVSSQLTWWLPLLGAHHLAAGFDWFPDAMQKLPPIIKLCQTISLLPHLAVWGGMVLAIFKLSKAIQLRRELSVLDHLVLLSLAVALCQGFLDAAAKLEPFAHFFNATWIVYVVLAWYAIDALAKKLKRPGIFLGIPLAAYIPSVATVLGVTMFIVHRDDGILTKEFGATLNNQIAAAHDILQFSPSSPLIIECSEWLVYPTTPRVLLALLPPPDGPRPLRRLYARDRNRFPADPGIIIQADPISHPSP